MNIGPFPVPQALQPAVPYLKFIMAVAGVVATAVVTLVAGPPAWAYLVITVVTALGVYTVPNSAVTAVLSDGMAAVTSAEDAVSDAKAHHFSQAGTDVTDAVKAAQATAQDVHAITQQLPKI